MILKNTALLIVCLILLNSCGGEKSENKKKDSDQTSQNKGEKSENKKKDPNQTGTRNKSTAKLEFFELYTILEIKRVLNEIDQLSQSPYYENDLNNTEESSSEKVLNSFFGSLKNKTINNEANNQIIAYANLAGKTEIEKLLKRNDIIDLCTQEDVKFMFSIKHDESQEGKFYDLYACKIPDGDTPLNSQDIDKAAQGYDYKNRPCVDLTMTDKGSKKWEDMTGKNIGKMIAITLDNVVLTAPVVQSQLSRNSQISGNFSIQEVQGFVRSINGGY